MANETPKTESAYAKKCRSGNRMYGPAKKTAKYPDFRPGNFHIYCTCDYPVIYNRCVGGRHL